MAEKFNGIILEVGGDTKPLRKALKEPQKEIHDLQSKLNQINKMLEFDPSNTELLAQKQRILGQDISQTKDKLEMLKKAQKQFIDEGGNVDSKGYIDLQQEIQITENQLKKLNKEQNTLNVNIQAFGNKLGVVGPKITQAGKGMMPLTYGIAGAGTAMVHFASDAEESANKVDVAFADSADSVKDFAETTLETYGIAEGTALDMTALFGDMATSMGLNHEEASKMSISLTGLAGDLASFKNISIDEAMTALNGVFTGETESMKRLGVVMTQTNLDAYALANGFGKTTSEMTEAEKVQLRYAYVMDKTKNAQGDFARTSDGTANSLRVFQEALKELAANLGEVLLPIVSSVVGTINDWLISFNKMDENTKKIIVTILGVVGAIGPLLIIIGTLCSSVSKIITLVNMVKGAMAIMNTVALGPTIAVIAGIVAGVMAAILIFKNWDEICKWFSEQWQTFTKFLGDKWNAFKDWFMNIGNTIVNFFRELPENLKQFGLDMIQKLVDGIEAKLGLPKGSINRLISNIKSIFADFLTNPFEWGADMLRGFADGIMHGFHWVQEKINSVTSWIKRHLHFSVPDEGPLADADKWGPDFMQLFASGIEQNKYKVFDQIKDLASKMNLQSNVNAEMSQVFANNQSIILENHITCELDGKEVYKNTSQRATEYSNVYSAFKGA